MKWPQWGGETHLEQIRFVPSSYAAERAVELRTCTFVPEAAT